MINTNNSPKKPTVKVKKDVIRKAVTDQDIEKWEVAQLSVNPVTQSKPSGIFEKLEEKRKIRHQNLLQQLARSLYEVNLKTEKNIQISSLELKAHVKDFDDKLKEIIVNIDTPEVVSYCASIFIQLQNKADEFKSYQQKLVNELHEDLMKFENQRAKENEKILHVACEEIRKVGYFLPYEVQTFVEHETLKMNKLSLNNRRCYEDLKLTLTLVTEQTFKSFMDKVYCIREAWVQRKLRETFYQMLDKGDKKPHKIIPEAYTRIELKGQELHLQMLSGTEYNVCRVEDWMLNVKEILITFDNYTLNVTNLYRKTVNAIHNGFETEGEGTRNELVSLEPLPFEERVIKPIIFEAEDEQIKELEEMEMYWQETLEGVIYHAREVLEFLVDVGKLWERHVNRVCESKKLILKALEKAEVNNQAVLQDLEIKFNMNLDALRQEHNEDKLEKVYEAVTDVLNSIKSTYEATYIEDVSTIEDFYKMMVLEADVLMADVQEFIYEIYMMDLGKIIHRHSEQVRYFPERKPIFKDIHLSCQKILALKSWKQGVWVALENLSQRTREALQPRADIWVQSKIESLAAKKSFQLELIDKRFERVQIEVYQKRLAEINSHQETLDIQKTRVTYSLKQLKDHFQNLVDKENSKINDVKENLVEVERNALLENRPGVIRGNQIMLERKKEDLEKELNMTFERFRADCDTKMSDLQQANFSCMKSIKMFHENGNYSSEEAKTHIALLETVDKEITTEFKNIIKESNKEENDIMKNVATMFNPLLALFTLLYEETLFNQEIQQRIKIFAQEIQELSKTLREDFRFLQNQFISLSKTVKNEHDPNSEVEEKFWNLIMELLYRNISSLLYPVFLPETPAEQTPEESLLSVNGEFTASIPCCCAGKFSINPATSKSIVLRTSEKDKVLNCKDYRNQLFNCDSPPINDGTFMAAMCNNIWEEMDFLQRAACDFYKKIQGRKVIREDLIPNNYDTLADKILTKFKYYNVQIQQFWLQILLDFLPLLGGIKSLANFYLEKKLTDYKESAVKALEAFERNFKSCTECQKCENQKELQDLDNKLLPLHGYPDNADLLSALEEEVVRKTANQTIQWESVIKKFKNEIKCFRVRHIQQKLEINKIEIIHFKMRNTIFVDDLSDTLLETILDYCENERFCIRKISINILRGEDTSQISEEVPEEHKLDIFPSESSLHDVQTYLKQLKYVIDQERSTVAKPPTCPLCPEDSDESYRGEEFCMQFCEKKLNILLEILDLEQPSNEILDGLNEHLRSMKIFANSQEKYHETELYKWLDNWKFNVQRVLKLYTVMYEEKEEEVEELQPQPSENNKPQTEKTSASVTSTFPRLRPTTKLDFKDTSCNIPKLKSLSLGSRRISNESKKRPGVINHSKTNLQKSKLTELASSDRVRGFTNGSLLLTSPRNYRGQIPVLQRHSLNHFRMSPPTTRSSSPLRKITQKDKSSSKVKMITLDEDIKTKTRRRNSRSPSPVKKTSGSHKKTKSRISSSPVPGNSRNSEKMGSPKNNTDSSKPGTSPRINSPAKRKSKGKVLSSSNVEVLPLKGKQGKELQRAIRDTNSIILKQASQPSLCTNEKMIQPQEKISLDHIKNEVYSGDHRRLSLEKVHLCIEQNFNLAERKRSYLVTYSSKELQNEEEISLSFLKNVSSRGRVPSFDPSDMDQGTAGPEAIRTPSGHELILTPSMTLDIEKEDADCLEISELLHETSENFEDKKEVHIPQDDANEYDSEVSTEGEMAEREPQQSYEDCNRFNQDVNSLWKCREADLLNDVDYRQSVYHPAVSRRQNTESAELEFRPKSKSIEDNYAFADKTTQRIVRTRSSNLKNKYSSHCFTDSMDSYNNERPWVTNFDKTDEKPMYNSVLQDVPYYGMKRIRTKKERVSGAFLRFTLKIIRLLAIFNLWPGDNCYMMTSQSLRFAR